MANVITAGNSSNGGTAITTDTSGTLNIVTGSGSGSNAITIDASQAVVMPGNLTVSGTLTASGGVAGGIRSGTAVASTSGTSIDFTSLPTGIKRITVMLSGVSTNGTSIKMLQLGTTSGFENTGYAGTTSNGSSQASVSSTGFNLDQSLAANFASVGIATIALVGSNNWVFSCSFGYSTGTSTAVAIGGGNKTLSGTLDRVRITTVNGTDAFDAGSINILFE